MKTPYPTDVDICLLLEGTYPYVSGGVSTWVHQLLSAYPDKTFGIFYIGAQQDTQGDRKYDVPSNVKIIEELYLFEPGKKSTKRKSLSRNWSPFFTALRKFLLHPPDGDAQDLDALMTLLRHVRDFDGSFDDVFQARQTWDVLCELHQRYAPEDSFLHFFWTSRYLVEPLWKLARALPRVPKARLYHSACTGYAGFLGAVLTRVHKVPHLLSEHGIYLRERIQDLNRSAWIPDFPVLRPSLMDAPGHFRRTWMAFFSLLSRLCYTASSTVVSLFERNARVQAHFGAREEQLLTVPNGINTESTDILVEQRHLRRQRQPGSQVVGYLGRIVTIKDVKTLLRSARLVCDVLPQARFLLAGPTDEEQTYYQECLDMVDQLHLGGNVEFMGLRSRNEVLPLFDVMALTSISEGLPFVVLESMAARVPLVCTDVGACRELLEGNSQEHPPLGRSGFISESGNAEAIARSLVELLTNRQLQEQMADVGLERVRRYYHESIMLDAYEGLYTRLTGGGKLATA